MQIKVTGILVDEIKVENFWNLCNDFDTYAQEAFQTWHRHVTS
jgi:hypothetical protein